MRMVSSIVNSKLVTGLVLMLLFGGAIGAAILLNDLNKNNPGQGPKLKIVPVVAMRDDVADCLADNRSLTLTITKPENGQAFSPDDDIRVEGSAEFGCANLLNENDYELKFNWYLNDGEASVSQEKSFDLVDIAEGTHQLTLTVVAEIEGSDNLQATTTREFKVNGDVLGITTTATRKPTSTPTKTPTPTPTLSPTPSPIPNYPPEAVITSPKDGMSYNACLYDDKVQKWYYDLTVNGIGTDPEEGNLIRNSLTWYYRLGKNPQVQFGTGNSRTVRLYNESASTTYKIIFVAKDSQGLTGQDSINVTLTNFCIY